MSKNTNYVLHVNIYHNFFLNIKSLKLNKNQNKMYRIYCMTRFDFFKWNVNKLTEAKFLLSVNTQGSTLTIK